MKRLFALLVLAIAGSTVHAQTNEVTIAETQKFYEIVPPAPPKVKKTHDNVWYHGELNAGFGLGEYDEYYGYNTETVHSFYLETVHGIHITQYFSIGMGLQYIHYECGPQATNESMPSNGLTLLLNARGYYPVNDKWAPYAEISVGEELLDPYLYSAFGLGVRYKKHWTFALAVQYIPTYGAGIYGVKLGYSF